jgi:hypothetical protein
MRASGARAGAPGVEAEERRLPWRRSERLEVEELTGQTTVPVLVIGGEAICDSRRIAEHLAWRDEERQRASSVEHGSAGRR